MNNKNVAVVYLRTAAQNSAAIEEQRRVCLQYAAAQGWTVLECIEEDGVGGHEESEGLAILRKIVRERRASVVVTGDATRISRDMSIYADFAQACSEHAVRIAFADGSPGPLNRISLETIRSLAERAELTSPTNRREPRHAAS